MIAMDGFAMSRGECGGAVGRTGYTAREVLVRADAHEAQVVKPAPTNSAMSSCRRSPEILMPVLAEVAGGGGGEEPVAYMVTQAHGLHNRQYSITRAHPPG